LSGRAQRARFGQDTLIIDLEDGRTIIVPVAWFPRLAKANSEQRANYELVGRGIGISWPDVDEDISVENLLGADGELLIARDLGMGMYPLAIEMVKGWKGSDEDLISRLCDGGWFTDRQDAKVWLAKERKALVEDAQ
jgi:hypothetical protein